MPALVVLGIMILIGFVLLIKFTDKAEPIEEVKTLPDSKKEGKNQGKSEQNQKNKNT